MGVSASFRWDILTGLQFESTFGLNTSNIAGESMLMNKVIILRKSKV